MIIDTDQSKNYWSLHEAIIDKGFSAVEISEEFSRYFNNVYEKDGKYYGFIEGTSYNTIVYEVKLLN